MGGGLILVGIGLIVFHIWLSFEKIGVKDRGHKIGVR